MSAILWRNDFEIRLDLEPTVLILDPDGMERHRIEGFLPVEDFLAQLMLGLGLLALHDNRPGDAERPVASSRNTGQHLGEEGLGLEAAGRTVAGAVAMARPRAGGGGSGPGASFPACERPARMVNCLSARKKALRGAHHPARESHPVSGGTGCHGCLRGRCAGRGCTRNVAVRDAAAGRHDAGAPSPAVSGATR